MLTSVRYKSILIIISAAISLSSASAQETVRDAEGTGSQSKTEREADKKESRLPEAEFVAGSSFRSASVVQPLWKDLTFDGHYFGGNENNVGVTGGSWTFHGEHWKIAPGLAVSFGDNGFRTMPTLTLRWGYEQSWFVTEGLYVQGLLHTKFFPEGTEPEPGQSASEAVLPSIADGNHASVRWKRLTAGGTWEHIQFREGTEWKGGLRAAYRVLPRLSLTLFVLGPETEVRGGILFQPDAKERGASR
jgi:hypothetical protein